MERKGTKRKPKDFEKALEDAKARQRKYSAKKRKELIVPKEVK